MDFGLTDEEFYRLTPRQFDLLDERFRQHLAHREMVAAYTTAAVINHSFSPPKEAVQALRFMPNAPQAAKVERTAEQTEADMEYNAKVLQKAAELKAFWAKRNG